MAHKPKVAASDDWARRREERMVEELEAFREKLRKKGKSSLLTQVLSVIGALLDPRYGAAALELSTLIIASAFGDRHRTCFICDRPFGPKRPLDAIVVTEYLGEETVFISGLCPRCVDDTGGLRETLIRDFGANEREIRLVHPDGKGIQ